MREKAMGTVLDRILEKKRAEVRQLCGEFHLTSLRRQALSASPVRDLVRALRRSPHLPVIAEIKRASPSAGKLNECADVEQRAQAYGEGGAAALSVITDGPFFGGSLQDMERARSAVDLPVLRKDFILDPVQLYESRISGADAVLLIAAALSAERLRALYQEALELGMTPLVEVHQEIELEAVLELNPSVVGINNRDLATLEVSLETCARLRPMIPRDVLVVGESGVHQPSDLQYLLEAGIDALLIGTALMRSPDPKGMLQSLCAVRRRG